MAGLTDLTIGASYDQLLITTNTSGIPATLDKILDGLGVETVLQLSTAAGGLAGLESSTTAKPLFTIKNTTNDTTAPTLRFIKDKGAAGADNDDCGTIEFYGDDDNQDNIAFATILAEVADASNGDECGRLSLKVAENDGTNTAGLVLTGSTTDGEVDVTVGAGAASAVAVPGVLNVTGLATFTGRLITDNTTEATSITDGSLQTDGGLSVAKDCVFGDDVFLITDGSVLNMGVGSDVKLTHDGTTGGTLSGNPLTIDSAGALNLYGTSINVGTDTDVAIDIDSDTLDIDASGAIDIDGTSTIDIGANANAGAMNIGTNATARTITIGNVTGATAVNLNSGTGGVALVSTSTGDITLTSADDIILDAADDIVIDSDGDLISMKWGGATGQIDFTNTNSGDGIIQQKINGKDLVIKKYDGTEVCRFEDGGTMRFGPAAGTDDWFRFPAVDGTANQVLSTDGSGAVTWSDQEDTAASATNATNFNCTPNNTADETVYPIFVDGVSGNQGAETDTGLTYNPSSGLFTTTTVATTGINSTGNFTLDSAADIILDAAGSDWVFKVGSTNTIFTITNISSGNARFTINGNNKDFTFRSNDGVDLLTIGEADGVYAGGITAGFNTLFGKNAGMQADCGDYNVYIGEDAGHESTSTAIRNVAIGYGAMYETDEGDYNTACGFKALYTSTTGEKNVSIGYEALFTAPSPLGNTAVGYQTLKSLSSTSTDKYNTAIGYYSMQGMVGGKQNVAIGFNAFVGDSSTTGPSNNIAIGSWAGTAYNSTDVVNTINSDIGDNNIFIGTVTGFNSQRGNTTDGDGYGNICIGYNATCQAIDEPTDGYRASSSIQIAIGKDIATDSGRQLRIGGEGNYAQLDLSSSTGDWTFASDKRLKTDIEYTDLGLSFINELNPVKFNMKDEESNTKKDGFIAQEIKEVMDKLGVSFSGWSESRDSQRDMDVQRLSYGSFVVPLVKAVQELSARVEHLEANNKTVTHVT